MIIADENIPPEIVDALRKEKVDVISIRESFRGLQDEDIIWLSKEMNRVILTEDKDFGEWVFAHHAQGVSVIFLRYSFKQREAIIASVVKIILEQGPKLYGRFTTVTVDKIRSRSI